MNSFDYVRVEATIFEAIPAAASEPVRPGSPVAPICWT